MSNNLQELYHLHVIKFTLWCNFSRRWVVTNWRYGAWLHMKSWQVTTSTISSYSWVTEARSSSFCTQASGSIWRTPSRRWCIWASKACYTRCCSSIKWRYPFTGRQWIIVCHRTMILPMSTWISRHWRTLAILQNEKKKCSWMSCFILSYASQAQEYVHIPFQLL